MSIINKNKEGLFNYEVLEKYEAGIALTGAEVKAVRLGQISLKGAYVSIDAHEELWLVNCHISPYQPAQGQQQSYNPTKPRKLLLHKKEIGSLLGKNKQKGLTIIPISVYTKRGLIKIEIGLVRGKTQIDKRDLIKKRETEREIRRTLKR